MAAPKENQLWKLRSRHNRDKIFASPLLLWKTACEYFEWCDTHPLLEAGVKGKDNTAVAIPKLRPYTLRGLCLYIGCSEGYIGRLEQSLRASSDSGSKELLEVASRIRDVIYTQKLEGAAAGLFSYNIIVRELGLTEKPDSGTDAQPPLTLHIQVADSSVPLAKSESEIS